MPETAPDSPFSRRRLKLSIGAAITLGLIVLSAAVGWGILQGKSAPVETVSLGAESTPENSGAIYVHVLGEVQSPGVYVLDASARLVDGLAAAGGTEQKADLSAVNLARPLTDGEQIIVPRKGKKDDETAPGESTDGKIDLNTADLAALETLPGIGPAIGQRIIDWREENGRFASPDDLLAVSGIGEKLLADLRDAVRV